MLLLLFGCGGRVELEQCAQGDRKGITNRLLRPKGTMEGSLRPCDDDRVKSLSHVQLFVTPWTVAYQASPSVGFSRQEHWSGLPFPPAGDLPHPEIEPTSVIASALAGGFFTFCRLLQTLFHCRLLQDIEYNSLCYTQRIVVYLF